MPNRSRPKTQSRAPSTTTTTSTKKAARRVLRRATLDVCGPDSRRPGGRLFHALCDLADRLLQRRGDPWARQIGTVLFYVAFHSARSADDDDFHLSLRTSLDMLVELEPVERWHRPPPPPEPPAGQPAPIPYPAYTGAVFPAARSTG
ncbi:uncharacterized protein SOCE26_044430 [Sorangium cellulosum]|uniref:Uncharacterized protein n=1 Tax=Sorangium cellulosum TaxID=56 RepID=A0A2L0EUN4_SORCE|nr:hypothetical protein [Sorangium cellulosum]AUX43003.1 uncharacterized protein SOCE26_044430 [Sorangium cellulosum]